MPDVGGHRSTVQGVTQVDDKDRCHQHGCRNACPHHLNNHELRGPGKHNGRHGLRHFGAQSRLKSQHSVDHPERDDAQKNGHFGFDARGQFAKPT